MITTDTKLHGATTMLRDLRDGKRPSFSEVAQVTQFLEPITSVAETQDVLRVENEGYECYGLKRRFLEAYKNHMTFGGLRHISDYSDLNMKESQELLDRMKNSVEKRGVAPMTRSERMKLNGGAITNVDKQRAEAVHAHRNSITTRQVQTWMFGPRAF